MDRGETRIQLERLITEAPSIAPSIARFDSDHRNYGRVTDEVLDVPSFVRWELEAVTALQQLAESGSPVFQKLHAEYLDVKAASKQFHSRSILVHKTTQLLMSAVQLLDSPWSESVHQHVPAAVGQETALEPARLAHEAPTSPVAKTELALPEKVTLAWAARHVPISAWLYLVGILASVFIAGISVGQLPLVRSLVPRLQESSPLPVPPTPTSVDEQIRRLTDGHNQRVGKLTEGIVGEEQAAGRERFALDRDPHLEAARRLRELLRDENDAYQKALAQLKTLGTATR